MYICIAGKNKCAVDAVKFLLYRKLSKDKIIILPNLNIIMLSMVNLQFTQQNHYFLPPSTLTTAAQLDCCAQDCAQWGHQVTQENISGRRGGVSGACLYRNIR